MITLRWRARAKTCSWLCASLYSVFLKKKIRPYFRFVLYGPKQRKKLHTNMCPSVFCSRGMTTLNIPDAIRSPFSRQEQTKRRAHVKCWYVQCMNLHLAITLLHPWTTGTGVLKCEFFSSLLTSMLVKTKNLSVIGHTFVCFLFVLVHTTRT